MVASREQARDDLGRRDAADRAPGPLEVYYRRKLWSGRRILIWWTVSRCHPGKDYIQSRHKRRRWFHRPLAIIDKCLDTIAGRNNRVLPPDFVVQANAECRTAAQHSHKLE